MPGILAGLKERSQSAYAAPAPKPVDNAIGHVRPNVCIMNAQTGRNFVTNCGKK